MAKNQTEEKNLDSGIETEVTVSLPNTIGIELVQANELRHYELFLWLVALMAPIAAGFWTAYATVPPTNNALLWAAITFTGLTSLFFGMAFYYRKKVYRGSVTKKVSLKDFR